jgi:type IV secretion system protein TrbE
VPVFEEYVRPKRAPDRVSDKVPWRAVIAPGVVLQKDRWQTLQRTYAVRGPDVMGLAREVQGSLIMQANNVLKKLGGKWLLNSEAQRVRVTDLPPLAACPPIVRMLDADHRARLLANPGIRETTYYLTLSWTPPPPSFQRWGGWFVRGPGSPARPTEGLGAVVQDFLEQADYLMDLLKGVLAECRPTTTPETLTYLHSCVSDRWYKIALLASLMDIDHQLCDTALDPAGWYPQLGRWHIRVCSVNGYPRQSVVGIMRDLEALPLDFRWCTRWLGLERHVQQGVLRKAQGAWVHEEKGLSDRLSENLSHEATRVLNRDATNKAEDVDIARQEIGADLLAYGQFTSTVTVWDEDPDVADQKRRMVMQAFAAREIATVEEGAHLVAAWFSSHPGNRVDNVNQTHQSSLTLAHLCPGLTAAWRGPAQDAFLGGGPWFYVQTEQNTLFRVVNHLRDLGHFMVLGATGSGKSTLGNWLRAMWLQYAHAQAKLFDIDGHGRLLTLLLGGSWFDLGSPTARFQPLRHVDDPLRRGIAMQWLLDLMEEYHVPVTAQVQAYLGNHVAKLAAYPPGERTFTQYLRLLQEGARKTEEKALKGTTDAMGVAHVDQRLRDLIDEWMKVRWVLQRFADGGEYDGLFDGTEADFDDHPVQTFELRDLLQRPRLLGPMLRYVLPQIELQMTTDRPMLLLFDDAAIPWEVPRIRQESKDWMRTTRKKAVSLGFMTHSLADVFGTDVGRMTDMGPMLVESCPVRFYLANPEASKPTIRAIYRQIGLEDTAIDQIAVMRPQRDAYYELREVGQRPFSLPFSRFILDCIARNDAHDHRLIDEILQKEGREGFLAGWMRHHGYQDKVEQDGCEQGESGCA